MTKAKSGAVRVSSSESLMTKKTKTNTKMKSSTSGSGMSIDIDFDLEEYGRLLMERTRKTLDEEEEKLKLKPKPKPKPKPKKKKKKKRRPTSMVGERRNTRLQTEKERDAKVKIGFPGGKDKDPRLNSAQEWRDFITNPIDLVDTSGESDSEPDDPVARLNFLKPCCGPHINVEDLDKHCMYLASLGPNPMKSHESFLKAVEKDGPRYWAELDLQVSKKALAFFNKKHNSDYELVETLGSFKGEYDGKWLHHCNFKAQKCPQFKDSRPSPKLFFGELFSWLDDDGENVFDVRSCYALDCCPTVRGCEMCPKPIRHPKDKFV